MSAVPVRDSRTTSSICLAKADLSILGERLEKRRLAPVRSTLLALLEATGEPGGWTRKALAERAGLGAAALRGSLEILETLGFLRFLEDGSLELVSPSGTAEAVPPLSGGAVKGALPDTNPRAQGLFRWHAAQVAPICGQAPSRSPHALAAAEKILHCETDSAAIKARFAFALGHRFYADKVLTLTGFERWWARINAAYLADARQAERVDGRPNTAPTEVSYEGDRVEVA